MQNEEIVDQIKKFIDSEVDDLGFAILYGSRALSCRMDRPDSDIDFKIFLKSEASDELRSHVARFAKRINLVNSSRPAQVSGDVPYEIKTLINKSTMEKALNLQAFYQDNGELHIPYINFTKDFLCSEECQMRTILCSLTIPNIFISGSYDMFSRARTKAFEKIKTLICSVYKVKADDYDEIIKLMIQAPDGRTYKNYLGYNNIEEIRSHLLSYISRKDYGI